MASTLFEAMSGVQPVNWGRLIQKYVEKFILHIGRKPSFLSPYILHLYHQYRCINKAEEDALTIAGYEVVYKLGPEVELTEAGPEESSEDHVAPEPTLPDLVHVHAPVPAPAHVPETRRAATPRPQDEGAPTREQPWRNINPAT
jgi:hypothetical protein